MKKTVVPHSPHWDCLVHVQPRWDLDLPTRSISPKILGRSSAPVRRFIPFSSHYKPVFHRNPSGEIPIITNWCGAGCRRPQYLRCSLRGYNSMSSQVWPLTVTTIGIITPLRLYIYICTRPCHPPLPPHMGWVPYTSPIWDLPPPPCGVVGVWHCPPSPPCGVVDGSHILVPYEIFTLPPCGVVGVWHCPPPPLWCGGWVPIYWSHMRSSPSPPVVWWGCGTVPLPPCGVVGVWYGMVGMYGVYGRSGMACLESIVCLVCMVGMVCMAWVVGIVWMVGMVCKSVGYGMFDMTVCMVCMVCMVTMMGMEYVLSKVGMVCMACMLAIVCVLLYVW